MKLSAFIPHRKLSEGLEGEVHRVLSKAGIDFNYVYDWAYSKGPGTIEAHTPEGKPDPQMAQKISDILNDSGQFKTTVQGNLVKFAQARKLTKPMWATMEGTEGWQCLECGKKFSKFTRKCPKCGSEDIDLDEFAVGAGDSGSGLAMAPEKHELQENATLSAILRKLPKG